MIKARALCAAVVRGIDERRVGGELLRLTPIGQIVEHRAEVHARDLVRMVEHAERQIHVVALFAVCVVIERGDLVGAHEQRGLQVDLFVPRLSGAANEAVLAEQIHFTGKCREAITAALPLVRIETRERDEHVETILTELPETKVVAQHRTTCVVLAAHLLQHELLLCRGFGGRVLHDTAEVIAGRRAERTRALRH